MAHADYKRAHRLPTLHAWRQLLPLAPPPVVVAAVVSIVAAASVAATGPDEMALSGVRLTRGAPPLLHLPTTSRYHPATRYLPPSRRQPLLTRRRTSPAPPPADRRVPDGLRARAHD
jgi:hypothetical protein